MAIQQVGGAKVYVITGSKRDPRLTSTGQSWANLVSQQKYRLWQEAQREALMNIKFDEMERQQQLQIQENLKKQLNASINDTSKTIQDLRTAQKKSQQAIAESVAREQNLRGRSKSITVGAGAGGRAAAVNPIDKDLALQADRLNDNILAAKKYNDNLSEQIADLAGVGGATAELNADRILELEQQRVDTAPLVNQLQAVQTEQELRTTMSDEEKRRELASFGTSTRRTVRTPDQPIVTPEPISYDEEIAKLEAERTALQERLAGIEPPAPLERPDLIQRTREVYGERFAPRRPSAPVPSPTPTTTTTVPTVSPTRALELETLGVREEPIAAAPPVAEEEIVFKPSRVEEAVPEVPADVPVRITPEQETAVAVVGDDYVKQFYTSQIEGLSNVGKAQKAMELLRDLDKTIPKEKEGHLETREAILKAYQMQVNPEAVQLIEAGKAKKSKPPKDADYAKLVNSLYSPSSDMSKEEIQELFDNAVNELKRAYKGKKLNQSLELLVQLHELNKG